MSIAVSSDPRSIYALANLEENSCTRPELLGREWFNWGCEWASLSLVGVVNKMNGHRCGLQ